MDIPAVKKTQNEKPKEFTSYEDIIGVGEDPNKGPLYPSLDPSAAKDFKPYDEKGNIANPFSRNTIVNVNNKGEPANSPTISQILRDFK